MSTNAPVKTIIATLFFVVGVFAEQPCDVLKRVVVTGASVTSGFGLTTPPIKGDLGAYPINMQHIMEGVITSEHEEVAFFGDLLFFKNSRKNAIAYIKQIKAHKPSLIVGIDFLFWFGHGTPPEAENISAYRMDTLNFAIGLLDELNVPMVIGNLPNVRDAVGRMLSTSQVPTEKTLQKLNARIHAWGDAHDNVTIIDVNGLWEKVMHDEEIVLHNHTWPAGSQAMFLQQDMLHTTFEGTVAASMLVSEALGVACFETDPIIIKKKAAASARADAKTKK
ncbi:MAG: hypothetical protein CMJ26_03340 [Phycisphaerae bacterium]|nr:hypothetical protein [Phycisphaerae bacterium]|tara:strand:+ start:259 stop:1095 length:837 start_codon:yes stop_codon:yes gene_type:complete